ncbi:hypothetical protein Tco_0955747 [Tanacetum coccineum]|uniref:Uncharacterized protein n=1 Tax=Tanacetum coccineum TaxID=301880 RepID=A0ABQ5E839_9ASTR
MCLDCGDPVHGLYCRQCALIRKTLEEVFQDTSKSSDDDTNFVNQEPFVGTMLVIDCVCDVPLCNNPTPLEAFKEHSETIIDSNNDYSSSDDDSYENIDYVSSEVVEIVIPEVGGIDTDILLTIKDDILREKIVSSSTSFNLFLEETNTFDNSLTESFCFDLEENNSGSTTTRSDYSLSDYEAFYDDQIKEKSSGSTTTHADFSQYDSLT